MSVFIIGGDKRQEYMCDFFKEKGMACDYVRHNNQRDVLCKIGDYSLIILPVPVSTDKKKIYSADEQLDICIDDIFGAINEKQTVIGGNIPEKYFVSKLTCKDLLKDESFVIFNAFLTAQGALALLLENTQEYIEGKKALVTGFGRVGKAVCRALKCNGLDVTVSARKEKDFSHAECLGYDTVKYSILDASTDEYDFIFSTVPARIFKEENIKSMKDNAMYFELASAPYGCDKSLFTKHNRKYIYGNGLPGRYCAKSWAKRAVEYCLNET